MCYFRGLDEGFGMKTQAPDWGKPDFVETLGRMWNIEMFWRRILDAMMRFRLIFHCFDSFAISCRRAITWMIREGWRKSWSSSIFIESTENLLDYIGDSIRALESRIWLSAIPARLISEKLEFKGENLNLFVAYVTSWCRFGALNERTFSRECRAFINSKDSEVSLFKSCLQLRMRCFLSHFMSCYIMPSQRHEQYIHWAIYFRVFGSLGTFLKPPAWKKNVAFER
jgi:hypothetical protein